MRTSFICVCLSLAACGGPTAYAVTGTSRAAGADGTIQVETIEGGNQMVTVVIDHLPPPERLRAQVYAVWIRRPGGAPTKAGMLEYDEDARSGRMWATTPHARFRLLITAEADDGTVSPSDIIIADRMCGG